LEDVRGVDHTHIVVVGFAPAINHPTRE
jgi:hypothetical protein